MVPMAALDNLIDRFMEGNFGIDTGLLITGSIWLMVLAYMTRFMAAALNAYDSGMATVPGAFRCHRAVTGAVGAEAVDAGASAGGAVLGA